MARYKVIHYWRTEWNGEIYSSTINSGNDLAPMIEAQLDFFMDNPLVHADTDVVEVAAYNEDGTKAHSITALGDPIMRKELHI